MRLHVDGELRQTWQDDFTEWRQRVAIGPRRSELVVRQFDAESLPASG